MHLLLASLAAPVVGALHWDPQIRGFLIFATAFVLLPGSVYLLLATNTGARVGLVLAVAGLSGWVLILSLVWAMYGIGMKGDTAQWKIKEIVTGDLNLHTSVPAAAAFPAGWQSVPVGQPALAEAQAAADGFLIPPPPAPEGTAVPAPQFAPPFKTTQDYVSLGGYTTGGDDYLFRIGSHKISWTIRQHKIYLKHQPHYFVVRVQPALPSITLAGAAATLPAADPTKPITSVVLIRDVGSKRLPPLMIALSSFLVFAVCCNWLHRRDKEIARTRSLVTATA